MKPVELRLIESTRPALQEPSAPRPKYPKLRALFMADEGKTSSPTWLSWFMGICAVIITAMVVGVGSWMVTTAGESKTNLAVAAVTIQNMGDTLTELKEDQKKIIELAPTLATKGELVASKQDLLDEIDKIKERLSEVEAAIGQTDKRRR